MKQIVLALCIVAALAAGAFAHGGKPDHRRGREHYRSPYGYRYHSPSPYRYSPYGPSPYRYYAPPPRQGFYYHGRGYGYYYHF